VQTAYLQNQRDKKSAFNKRFLLIQSISHRIIAVKSPGFPVYCRKTNFLSQGVIMKKLIILLLAICIVLISGCAKSNAPGVLGSSAVSSQVQPTPAALDSAQSTPSGTDAAPPSQPQAKPSPSVVQSPSNTSVAANPFFFKTGGSVQYKAIFSFNDSGTGEATLQIQKIADLAKGTVYELKLDAIKGVPDERLSLGYFYVQKDKIYKTDPTQDSLNILKTSEIPCSCFIVCQEKAAKDSFEGQLGFHQYITANGDQREYHSYNDETATGYYESFTWEKGKGLISYRSGFGAEKDSIELQLDNN
jgi:hypothetical protein